MLDGCDRALLADVGLAKQGAAESEAQTHLSTRHVQGTPGYLDQLIVNGLQHSTLTDGYAMGITMLVALTGKPAIGLLRTCRQLLRHPERPDKWQPPGVPDDTAGGWPAHVATQLAAMARGLTEEFEEERMTLAETLRTLEAIVREAGQGDAVAGTAVGSPAVGGQSAATSGGGMAPAAVAEEPRECMICMSAPRAVRFLCGHR